MLRIHANVTHEIVEGLAADFPVLVKIDPLLFRKLTETVRHLQLTGSDKDRQVI